MHVLDTETFTWTQPVTTVSLEAGGPGSSRGLGGDVEVMPPAPSSLSRDGPLTVAVKSPAAGSGQGHPVQLPGQQAACLSP